MTDRKLIVANWKMNGSLAAVREYGAALSQKLEAPHDKAQVVVAPPYPYLMFMDGRLAPAHRLCAAVPREPRPDRNARFQLADGTPLAALRR